AAVRALLEGRGVRVDELDPADLREGLGALTLRHDRDRAVAADRELDVRRDRERAVVAELEIAAPRLEQAERVDPERTVPSQRLGPVRRLDRDPAGTVDRDVEGVAGLDERPRRRIETAAARDAVHPARVAGPLLRQG